MIRIKIEGKNIADIWKLKCVKQITKRFNNDILVSIIIKKNKYGVETHHFAIIGDEIEVESEQSETGKVIIPFTMI